MEPKKQQFSTLGPNGETPQDHNDNTGLPADFSTKHPDGKNKTLDEMAAELKVSREDARHVQVKGRLPKKHLKGE